MSYRGNPRARGTSNGQPNPGHGAAQNNGYDRGPHGGGGRNQGYGRGAGRGTAWGTGRGAGDPAGAATESARGFPSGRGAGRGAGRAGGRGGRGASWGAAGGPGQTGEPQSLVPIFEKDQQVPVPDPSVMALENQIVSRQATAPPEVTALQELEGINLDGASEDHMLIRPGYGTSGREVLLRSNHYELKLNGDQELFRYSVEIRKQGREMKDKEPMAKRRKRSILEILFKTPEFLALNGLHATDWASMVITTRRLPLGDRKPANRKVFTITDGPAPSDCFSVQVQETGHFHLKELLIYVSAPTPKMLYSGMNDVIQILNIILSKAPDNNPNLALIGRDKYYIIKGHQPGERHNLGAAVDAIRGFHKSVRPATGRVLVNINTATTAVYKPCPLPDLMREVINSGKTDKDLERFLKGLQVEVSHLRGTDGKPRVRVISGLARKIDGRPGCSSEFRFLIDEKLDHRDSTGHITVKDYFQEKYSVPDPETGNHAGRWVVKTGDRNKNSFLPPYVCKVIPGQALRRTLSPLQQSEMMQFACRSAAANAEDIQAKGLPAMGLTSGSNFLKSAGIVGLNRKMITVPGRVLNGPQVQYLAREATVSRGRWNLQGAKFKSGRALASWAYLLINEIRSGVVQGPSYAADLAKFQKILQENLAKYGVRLSEPHAINPALSSMDVDLRDETDTAEKIEERLAAFDKAGVRFVFILLPRQDSYLYSRIKYFADVSFGIHTVDMIGSKLHITKPNHRNYGHIDEQYLANIALKVNLKLGGINHTIRKVGPIDHATMVVGIDVTHPSLGSKEYAPSIAGIVASIDANLAQWPASLRLQTGRKEMVGGPGNEILKEMMKERLRLWQQHNQQDLPNKLLIYRDGVSEGQYESVLRDELPQIVAACKDMYPANWSLPKVTIIVVGKRHHTRFYPTNEKDSDGSKWGNPQNGTVVDRGVTMAKVWDFFLQAHKCLQGTARPAHYVVIKDDIGFGADELQTLTHNMCYLFGRSTTAVSICPPAYYADRVCDRARHYFRNLFSDDASSTSGDTSSVDPSVRSWGGVHERLKDTMFYL